VADWSLWSFPIAFQQQPQRLCCLPCAGVPLEGTQFNPSTQIAAGEFDGRSPFPVSEPQSRVRRERESGGSPSWALWVDGPGELLFPNAVPSLQTPPSAVPDHRC
jgi:hypothetical protein